MTTLAATLKYRPSGTTLLRYGSWLNVPLRWRITIEERQQIAQLRFVTSVTSGEALDSDLHVHLRPLPTLGTAEVIGLEMLRDICNVIGQNYDWEMQPLEDIHRTTLRRAVERLFEILALHPLRMWVIYRRMARTHPRRWI